MYRAPDKVLHQCEKKCIQKKIATFFGFNGQVNVSSSSSESSGFFNSFDSFLHTKFTNFAALVSVLKYPKCCILPSIRSVAFHGFFCELLFLATPIYFEAFLKKKSKTFDKVLMHTQHPLSIYGED